MTIEQAIAESITEDRVVHLAWSAELEADLLAVCDDSADVGTVTEYWGEDGDRAWRVHLLRGEG